MKHLLIILALFIAGILSAQQEKTNRFIEEEKVALPEENFSSPIQRGPGDPPVDPDLPIDDYVPFLILTAIGLIVSTRYMKDRHVSENKQE